MKNLILMVAAATACCAWSDFLFYAFHYPGDYHGFTMSEANPLEGDTFCHTSLHFVINNLRLNDDHDE